MTHHRHYITPAERSADEQAWSALVSGCIENDEVDAVDTIFIWCEGCGGVGRYIPDYPPDQVRDLTCDECNGAGGRYVEFDVREVPQAYTWQLFTNPRHRYWL